ncbi:MAG: glycerol kinase GlpK [SAR202 cluster bacterium]|nr:glycerol kinase GlpK [SAR202 cluster bacterium]|tara:strand:- start:16221 stop:17705 length:1485 start_codon:yes stop_codon:yes gene_type:complete
MSQNILSIDQGTTSTRVMIFNSEGKILSKVSKNLRQIYPRSGWVEQDPNELINSVISLSKEALRISKLGIEEITSIGIANQRETTIIWDKNSGKPVYNAIVWQDNRTSDLCIDMFQRGLSDDIKKITGLVIDPYFSSTKIRWILDNIPDGQKRAENGELLFGTVDSWIIWNISSEKNHYIDSTNASRTMLMNIHDLEWDDYLLKTFNIPLNILPKIKPSIGEFGVTAKNIFTKEIPITGVAGDQSASLYGQACFEKSQIKCTYGTGAFIMVNSGSRIITNNPGGLLRTLAYNYFSSKNYALEGSILSSGSTMSWLRDNLGIISNLDISSDISKSLDSLEGLYFVPSFAGLGAPHWNTNAKAMISGISFSTHSDHIIRAALESTAYQVKDIVESLDISIKSSITSIRVDGGQTSNDFLMQFQADILGLPIEVSKNIESTALGAAFMSGIGSKIWKTENQLKSIYEHSQIYEPKMNKSEVENLYSGWLNAINKLNY